MTKQHIWPNWISNSDTYSRFKQEKSHVQTLTDSAHEHNYSTRRFSITDSPPYIERQGDVLSRKVRMVCRVCNNTWMSRIEEESKDIILSIHSGVLQILHTEEIQKIVSWAALMTIVAEFTDIPNKAIIYSEREYFM